MAAISLVGIDTAGGVITGPGASNWTWVGSPISLQGDSIASHGDSPHRNAVITRGSAWMSINGIPVTTAGSLASCGHVATGSATADID